MAKDKTPSDVSKIIKDCNVKLIDFKFTDLLGTWQHFTTTLTEYNEEIFTDGLGFDGSSIRGWRACRPRPTGSRATCLSTRAG